MLRQEYKRILFGEPNVLSFTPLSQKPLGKLRHS